MQLGDKLRFFRNKVSKSQKKVGAETGIPQTTISGWENGISEPTLSDAHKLANALGVTVNDLLDDTDQGLPRTG